MILRKKKGKKRREKKMRKDDNTPPADIVAGPETATETAVTVQETALQESGKGKETALQILKKKAKEEDPRPSASLTFGKIIGGDILSTDVVRSQIWLFLLIVLFTIVYVAFRYQCQQDMITIDKLETELKDAKYKALSSSSALTERCRESHVLEILKNNNDSLLHVSDRPPYIIKVPEK